MSARLEQPVIGYRIWLTARDALCALDGTPWALGDVKGRCRRHPEHSAPELECGCGVYALHRPPPTVPEGCALGAVVAWGSLALHADGFRAEHARPVALAKTPSVASGLLVCLAKRHSIPLVEVELLPSVAQEFGAAVAAEQHPLDRATLLGRAAAAISRRENCLPAPGLPDLTPESFGHRVIACVSRARQAPDLAALLRSAWHSSDRPDIAGLAPTALKRLREEAMRELVHRPSVPADETRQLLHLLNVSHGSVPDALRTMVDQGRADAIPTGFLLSRFVMAQMPALARERAREILQRSSGLLPMGVEEGMLLLEPELDDRELESLLPRMGSSSDLDRLLRQTVRRGPHIAIAALRSGGISAVAAAEILGRSARPMLLRHLRRNPYLFRPKRSSPLRAMVGDQELRLAARRALTLSSDATDLLLALKLLPGDEARSGLRRAIRSINGLRPGASDDLRTRAWNLVCSGILVGLLDLDTVRGALGDRSLGLTNHVLLLRAHPTADPARADRLWESADLRPRFAVDVLRATGPRKDALVRRAVQDANTARSSNAAAARLAAAMVVTADADVGPLGPVDWLALDEDQPTTIRALAAWMSGCGLDLDDPLHHRYQEWVEQRAPGLDDPVAELLSGGGRNHAIL